MALARALDSAKSGIGSTWILQGPMGIGKTRLAQWMDAHARGKGYGTHWGICFKESLEPLFPWQQMFRKQQGVPTAHADGKAAADFAGPAVLILEIERPGGLGKWLSDRVEHKGELFVSRDKPSTVREKLPGIPPEVEMIWLTRVEGSDNINPANIDILGERLEAHLRKAEGNTVVLEGLEYLVSQSTFGGVYNFLQFMRDLAQETKGHLVLSFRPSAFERKDVSLIETLGDVIKDEDRPGPYSLESGKEEPLATQMLRYLDTLEDASRRQPQLLILEDIHWADPPSLKMLQFLSRNIRNFPVVVVATLRSQDDGKPVEHFVPSARNDPLELTLEDMDREGCSQKLELHGLAEGDLLKVAEGVVGGTMVARGGSEHLKSLLEHSQGNPYSLISAMHLLADQGRLLKQNDLVIVDLIKEGSGGRVAFAFPRSVLQAAQERMARLSESELNILLAGSIGGQEINAGAIADALGMPEQDVTEACRRLAGDGFLRASESGGNRWAFSNAIAWEAAHELVPGEKSKNYALSLARWWTKNASMEEETIARLYHDAQEPEEGVPRVRKAIELTLKKGSPDMVLRLHRWLQELLSLKGTDPDERVREGLKVTERLEDLHGRSWAHLAMLEELEALMPSYPLPEILETRVIRILSEIDIAKAKERLEKLLKVLPSQQQDLAKELLIGLALAKIEVLSHQGKYEEAIAAADEGLELLGPDEAQPDRPGFLRWKVLNLIGEGKASEAMRYFADFKVAAEASGDEAAVGQSLALEAQLAFLRGDMISGKEYFRKSLKWSEKAGRTTAEIANLYNLGMTQARLKETADARKSLQDAKVLAQRFGHSGWFGCFLYIEGEILLAEDRPAEALPILRHIVEEGETSNLGEEAPQARIALAEACLRVGKPADADEVLQGMEATKARVQYFSVPRFYRVKALVAGALGKAEEARKLLAGSIEAAASVGNQLEEGLSCWELAAIEERHGDPEKGKALRLESQAKFDSCGLPSYARPKSA